VTSNQTQVKYFVLWHYGPNGEEIERSFARESAAKDNIRRMRGFRHHTLCKPRGLRIEVREIGAEA
jgi:hypothetical protein